MIQIVIHLRIHIFINIAITTYERLLSPVNRERRRGVNLPIKIYILKQIATANNGVTT